MKIAYRCENDNDYKASQKCLFALGFGWRDYGNTIKTDYLKGSSCLYIIANVEGREITQTVSGDYIVRRGYKVYGTFSEFLIDAQEKGLSFGGKSVEIEGDCVKIGCASFSKEELESALIIAEKALSENQAILFNSVGGITYSDAEGSIEELKEICNGL